MTDQATAPVRPEVERGTVMARMAFPGGDGWTVAPSGPPVVPLSEVRDLLRRLRPSTPVPHRCEVDSDVLTALRATQPQQAGYGGSMGDLLGIPIVVRDHLDPTEWRLLDQDGNVLAAGRG